MYKRQDLPYVYAESLEELAAHVDFLIVSAPGGEETHHMVGRAVMDALGPDGVLVNVGRGSIVDTEALIGALCEGTLGAAALDVLEGEPEVPSSLLAVPNLMLTPHMASLTKDALQRAHELAARNIEAHFAGERVLSPVV